MSSRVSMRADGKIKCRGCGKKVKGEYKAQNPAPCGCAWVWEKSLLVAVSSRK